MSCQHTVCSYIHFKPHLFAQRTIVPSQKQTFSLNLSKLKTFLFNLSIFISEDIRLTQLRPLLCSLEMRDLWETVALEFVVT